MSAHTTTASAIERMAAIAYEESERVLHARHGKAYAALTWGAAHPLDRERWIASIRSALVGFEDANVRALRSIAAGNPTCDSPESDAAWCRSVASGALTLDASGAAAA